MWPIMTMDQNLEHINQDSKIVEVNSQKERKYHKS